MSTKTQTAEFLVEQLGAGVTAKKMFGEYGLYLDGRLFAMVCDDLLFVKTTPGGRDFLAQDGEVKEGPPYPGAKNALVVDSTRWDDADWMTELAAITSRELPSPLSKHAKAGKRPPILAARPSAPKPAEASKPAAAAAPAKPVEASKPAATAKPAAPPAAVAAKPKAAAAKPEARAKAPASAKTAAKPSSRR